MLNFRYFMCLMVFGALMMCHSCSTCSRQQAVDDITVDMADWDSDSTYINVAKKVFHVLPTPVELSLLIKNSGIAWQPALLNNPANVSKYATSREMALNFGAYITDLTYASLFEQPQTVLHYRAAIRQLTEGLGLQSAIDLNTMQQLEESINDRDAVLRIVADLYASCTATLDENDRYFLTLAALAGGWIEGMYIAVSTLDAQQVSNENRIRQLIIDQKLTFDLMWKEMSSMKDSPDIAAIMNDFSELAQLFGQIVVHQTPNVVTVAEDGTTAGITSSSSIDSASLAAFTKIREQIQALRQNITKK